MNALLILLILLLALFICSFLGSKYFQEGFYTPDQTNNPPKYVSPNGDTAYVVMNSNGTQTINVVMQSDSSGNTYLSYIQPTPNSQNYISTNNNGTTASISGNLMIVEVSPGQNIAFTTTSNSLPTTTSTDTNNNGSNYDNYDNYNHYTGSSNTLTNGETFTGVNGGTVVVTTNSNGSQSLQVTLANGQQPITFTTQSQTGSYTKYTGSNGNMTIFYGPNGGTATIVNSTNGQRIVNVETSSGSYIFTYSNPISNTPNTITNTQYYGSTGYQIPPFDSQAYNKDPTYYPQSAQGNSTYESNVNNLNNEYDSTLPQGIPASKIPPGQEDMYILKSQIVPPVCPVCPAPSSSYAKKSKCPPCPACERCPEPSMTCKAVPNYNAIDQDKLPKLMFNDFSRFENTGSNLPMPILNDFSTFGI